MRIGRSLKVFRVCTFLFALNLASLQGQGIERQESFFGRTTKSLFDSSSGLNVGNQGFYKRSPNSADLTPSSSPTSSLSNGHGAGQPIPTRPLDSRPTRREFSQGECDLVKPAGDFRGTLGGSGEINGYYFDSKTNSCEATYDLGSASPHGPFRTLVDCELAVDSGKCH